MLTIRGTGRGKKRERVQRHFRPACDMLLPIVTTLGLALSTVTLPTSRPNVPTSRANVPTSRANVRLQAPAAASALTPTELATKAREWVLNDGFHKPAKQELMADDFVWFGPIVGPLNKQDFLGTVGLFEVWEGFPDLDMKLSEFTQDPAEPNRFWAILRLSGTHTGVQKGGTGLDYAPTGNVLDVGPQAVSVTFDEEGLVSRYTGGYIVDRRQGSTGEFGGYFAVTKTVGGFLPSQRLAKLLNWIGAKLKKFPKARSHEDDLPAKWRPLGRTHGVRTDDAW